MSRKLRTPLRSFVDHIGTFSFLPRSVGCPSVFYEPVRWRELFILFFKNLPQTNPALWEAYHRKPMVEFIEDLKAKRHEIPLARLVLGWGFANKTEVMARALLVLEQREQKRPWALATLERYVTRPGWLEDLADVYLTYLHDTILLYGPR